MRRFARREALPCKEITDAWRGWIAENLMLDCDPDVLVKTLVQNGIAAEVARAEIDAARASGFLQGARRLKNRLAKRDWALDIHRKLNRLRPEGIARRECLSTAAFLRDFYCANQPVIITGMMKQWPALQKWTLPYLRTAFGDSEVEIQFGRNANPEYEMHSLAHKRLIRFADYVDLVARSGATNDFYMTANNDAKNRAGLAGMWKDVGSLPAYLSEREDGGFLWFGPAGTITPFHHDLTNNLMAQIVGRKRVRIIASCELSRIPNFQHCFTPIDGRAIDVVRYPDMAEVTVHEYIIEPGELLFLPVGCWHFVESLDISVTIAFTNFRWDNDFFTNYPECRDF